ncbi:MAG: FRG domain-containing protein [Bacteroidetes bacterium]|nr:FRG domain-containing protein [Bacteroidota bacterium]
MDAEYKIKDFLDLISFSRSFNKDTRWHYRGQSDINWELIPKAGRAPFNKVNDQKNFNKWQKRAVEYLTSEPTNDWDWLVLAQHHGLPTRLLDWTQNVLVAAFFACYENQQEDGVIFMLFDDIIMRKKK